MSKKPLVSVIVPTKNSEKFLEITLKSVRDQTYEKIELIVVDNYSSDGTKTIALKYTDKVFNKGSERSSQVNYGAKLARGKYLYRIDHDFYVEPRVVEQSVFKCEMGGFDCVAVHNTSDPKVSFWAKVRKFERDMYKNDPLIVGSRFWSKKVFESVGGFNEEMVACEDYDLHNRILQKGFKIARIRAQEIHLGEPRSLKEIVVKSYEYGRTLRAIVVQGRLKYQLSPIRFAFIKHIHKFMLHPMLASGFFVMNLSKYFAFQVGKWSS